MAKTSRNIISISIIRPRTPTCSFLYKYPQARSPTRSSSRRTAGARPGPGVRAARHGHLRRRSLLRHLHRVRQATAEDIVHPHRGGQSRAGGRPRCTFCRTSGSATPGPGDRRPGGRTMPCPSRRSALGPRREPQPGHATTRSGDAERFRSTTGSAAARLRPAGGTAALHRQRDQRPRVFGPGNRSRKPFVKDAFHRWLIDGEDVHQPERDGTKAAIHYRSRFPPGGSVVLRLRLPDDLASADPLGRGRRDLSPCGERRRMSSTQASTRRRPPRTSGGSSGRRLPACCGSKQSYLFDVRPLARRRQSRIAASRLAATRSATSTGGI